MMKFSDWRIVQMKTLAPQLLDMVYIRRAVLWSIRVHNTCINIICTNPTIRLREIKWGITAILNYDYIDHTISATHAFNTDDWADAASKLLSFQKIYDFLRILPVWVVGNISNRVLHFFIDTNDDICISIIEIV